MTPATLGAMARHDDRPGGDLSSLRFVKARAGPAGRRSSRRGASAASSSRRVRAHPADPPPGTGDTVGSRAIVDHPAVDDAVVYDVPDERFVTVSEAVVVATRSLTASIWRRSSMPA